MIQKACEDLDGCDWAWQVARHGHGEAPKGNQLGPNPTDRAKRGVKRSLIVEADGGPRVSWSRAPTCRMPSCSAPTIDAIVLERPLVADEHARHLALDKGYDNAPGWGACIDHDYQPHIALIRDERPQRPHEYKPRRWVVERTLAWLSMCRGILIRWGKKSENDLGLLTLACALIWFRRYHRLADLR